MRVLLISANQERLPDPIPPIGLSYVADAARRAGHQVLIFDLTFRSEFEGKLTELIGTYRPDVIGLSLRNVDNVAFPVSVSYVPHYTTIAQVCKRTAPETPLVVGGSAFSLFPQEFMERLAADYGVVGEGENVFVELLAALEAAEGTAPQKGSVLFPTGKPVDLDEIAPAWDLLDVDRYFNYGGSINLQTKRGCPYRCGYCTYPFLEGRKVRQTDPKRVVDLMESSLEKYKTDYFFFVDNVFNFPPAHSIAICEEIIRRKLKVKWTAYVSPAHADEELFAIYKKAGCTSLDFGTDSVSELGLESLTKSFTIEDVLNCSAWARKYRIKFNHSVIFGVPGETRETVEEAIENLLKCQPTAVTAMIGFRIHRNTPLAAKLVAEGWISQQEIGLEPVFYIEEGVRDYIVERMEEMAAQHANWIVPGLERKIDEGLFQTLRAKGLKGPLWKFL